MYGFLSRGLRTEFLQTATDDLLDHAQSAGGKKDLLSTAVVFDGLVGTVAAELANDDEVRVFGGIFRAVIVDGTALNSDI